MNKEEEESDKQREERENCWLVEEAMRRIPSIKFPSRRPNLHSSFCGAEEPLVGSKSSKKVITMSSDVPAAPQNTAIGGSASLQPKRTPVSDKEIEAVLLGGCI